MVNKPPAKEKESEFHVLVADVDKSRLDAAAEAFASSFGLEAGVAQQIVKSAPIVFLASATKSEIKAITPRLIEASKSGIEFRVTTRSVQKIPKVNWPVRPQFSFGAAPMEGKVAFSFEHNIFVCPCCGETFLFRRVGKPPLGEMKEEAPAAPAAPPRPAAPPAPAPARRTGKPAPPPLDETAVPEPPPEEPAAEPAENLLADESIPAPAEEPLLPAEEELNPVEEPASAPEPAPLFDEPLDIAVEEPDAPPPPPPPKPAAAPKPVAKAAPAPAPKAAPAPAPKPTPAPVPKPAAPPPPAEEPEAEQEGGAEGGDTFNVFLSKITSGDKKEQAAKLISDIKACAIEDARELAGRLIIPLLKDVSKTEAETALNKFKGIKVTGRITISRKR